MLITSLLHRFGIHHVVVCPGSRNAPLVDAFARCAPTYSVHPVTDERSAGFVAIGLAESLDAPVAVCVTSGTAVANLYPAVIEAYHRNIPLVVISADRPMEWIDQMDGQTMSQPGAYVRYAEYCDILPENDESERLWYNNRELNRILNYSTHSHKPCHINIQLREPLFNFENTEDLIDNNVRMVSSTPLVLPHTSLYADAMLAETIKSKWQNSERIMIIVGQHKPDPHFASLLARIKENSNAVILAESLSNLSSDIVSGSYNITPNDDTIAPDLLLYLGGHIVNKDLKLWLRKQPIPNVWQLALHNYREMPDLFQQLSLQIYADSDVQLLEALSTLVPSSSDANFVNSWQKRTYAATPIKPQQLIVNEFLSNAGLKNANLVLANSSSIRYAQKCTGFNAADCAYVTCNRGVNGIEGTISQAVGVALANPDRLTVCLTGDLSFFYDHNALWNVNLPSNLRILLINDGGGEIFKGLKGLELSPVRDSLVMASHNTSAEGWCRDCRVDYLASHLNDSQPSIEWLLAPSDRARVLEFTLWV
ncbi:MAG: 2-succinyl-5-enolpyruvyl-6-hydroxy-3-cyclohexene-1-carboxylic-acid synthase [Bacteroidia bacterium]|nr:2-succinyl-5-enolpyruvyl-6-hydroxy-3-cyclohexene-1-carboxylic-acid synthase [Bacteroidia bacterium]